MVVNLIDNGKPDKRSDSIISYPRNYAINKPNIPQETVSRLTKNLMKPV